MENRERTDFERSLGRVEGKLDSVISVVTDLKSSFDSLEKGRLSRLEVAFATLHTEVSVKAKNSAMWSATIISVVVSVVTAIIIKSLL